MFIVEHLGAYFNGKSTPVQMQLLSIIREKIQKKTHDVGSNQVNEM